METYVKLFCEMMDKNKITIPKEGLLAGWHASVTWCDKWMKIFEYDNVHFPMGNAFLRYGLNGIVEKAEACKRSNQGDAAYMEAIQIIYKRVIELVEEHAREADRLLMQIDGEDEMAERKRLLQISTCCHKLAKGIPSTFQEALQLFWFMYIIRSPFGNGCIGRLDQKLYPFFEADKKRGALDEEEVLDEIVDFYRKLNQTRRGDTLRNLMLSGQDEKGKDETNELTYLFLKAYEKTLDAEPHLNVRLHKNSPQTLVDEVVKLLEMGKGQPTLYFDECIMPAMEKAGIPHEKACCYANDGCTETVIDDASSIFFLQHEMVKTMELTLFNGKENPYVYPVEIKKSAKQAPAFTPKTGLVLGYQSGNVEEMNSFSEVYDAFLRQLNRQLEEWIKKIDEKIRWDEEQGVTSPFLAGTFAKCLETGKDPLRGGGFEVPNYQLLSGSIGTAADCLRGIEEAVFVQKWCTMDELLDALRHDFEGYEILRQRLKSVPKYGNADKHVDEIAGKIGNFFLEKVTSYRSRSGKRIWPGLYNIDFKIFADITGATPDGRKFRDAIGEHCSPTPGAAKQGPTAIMESASAIPMEEGYASSPLHLTLDKGSFVMGAEGTLILQSLIGAATKKGIPVLNISMYSRQELEDAMEHPEKHNDLIVRVWGYNARFVDLDEKLQEHIIARISE